MREYLRNLRESNELTQQQAAEKTGMSRSNYTNVENGARQTDMGFSVMKKLAQAFSVPIEKIVQEEEKYQKHILDGDTKEAI
ncbi:helix-turn-helix transcriptional regulator [Christensenella minuta]|uniref:helix-turn-helix transcriptional regulator n=1 Tax=Christensenella minuta TaxID=626937 RepID=UPI002157C8D5|nr:helix-turn-helix transcriptional regulator [Christensenella minuta]